MTAATDLSGLDEIFDAPAPTSSEPLLALRDLSVNFGGIAALTDLHFDVGPTDLVAIIGPNGAGKTTALNAISRIVPSSGGVTFGGTDISRRSMYEVSAAGIGRSFQDPPLIDHYSALENVMCGSHLRTPYRMFDQIFRRRLVSQQESVSRRRAQMLLRFVGLADAADREAGELPYGARKLIDIARAMVGGPQLLMLDEPSSGLDREERMAVQNVLIRLAASGRVAVLVVEHHMDLVRATATHVLALQSGTVLMTGSPTEVLDSEEFRTAMVGSTRQHRAPGKGSTDSDPQRKGT